MRRRLRSDQETWLLSYADLITNLLIFFVMLLSASELSKVKFQQIAERIAGTQSSRSLSAIQKEMEEAVEKAGLQKDVTTRMTDQGLELIFNSGVVFDTGSAEIRPEWTSRLMDVLQTVVPFASEYRFAIEGHTDTQPIIKSSRFPSNWELSSARAMEVRSRLEGLGVNRDQIRVEAYADTKPLPEGELSGLSADERLARHRRVVVRLY